MTLHVCKMACISPISRCCIIMCKAYFNIKLLWMFGFGIGMVGLGCLPVIEYNNK